MNTKQIFEINMDKNKLIGAIIYSWNEFLKIKENSKINLLDFNKDFTLLKYKNFFLYHINEFYKEFEDKKEIIHIKDDMLYDVKNKSLFTIVKGKGYFLRSFNTNLFYEYMKYVHDRLPSSNKNIYFRNGDSIYVHYIDKNGIFNKIFYVDAKKEDDCIIYGFRLLDDVKDDLKSIFFMFITSDLYSNEFSNNKSYKILKSFAYENKKFILKNPENLKIDKEYFIPLLSEDKIRADLKEYDEKMLEDVERGLWELWEMANEKKQDDDIAIKLEHSLTARDPKSSIKDGVVGIDFGTKSTVVVYQEDTVKIHPMRIGIGDLGKTIEKNHYENPTIISFNNLTNFMKSYNERAGRPYTKWADVNISHTAQNSLLQSASSDFNSYLSELKQWAGAKDKKLKIFDKKNVEFEIKGFCNLKDDDINPIEIYAYYLGLYINNQYNGVFLDYLLSFPVTYEIEVRKKILASFKKGIQKSLPMSLQTPEILDKLSVVSGASEPAAYAIMALDGYGLNPEGGEKIFFGVFDFGGGTTDFDFGIYEEAVDSDRYDYIIEHFGAGGDKYLGGENLLELISFEVFKKNAELLLKEEITFTKPFECEKFLGSEMLISNSQESKRNTKELMEKLRPLWEGDDNEGFENGELSLNLINKYGKQIAGTNLDIDKNEILEIIKKRIKRGVDNFFEALRLVFDIPEIKEQDIKKINIFLAGNSSKSKFVEELFNERIEFEKARLEEKEKKSFDGVYEIYRPLGENSNDFEKPNGKTGVAFGLIRSKKGGNILVIDRNVNKDINFTYYLGRIKKGKFNTIIKRSENYNEWFKFIDASESIFEVFYTTQASATTNSLDISDSAVKKIRLDTGVKDDNSDIYIRIVTPNEFEYVVSDDIEHEKYKSLIKRQSI